LMLKKSLVVRSRGQAGGLSSPYRSQLRNGGKRPSRQGSKPKGNIGDQPRSVRQWVGGATRRGAAQKKTIERSERITKEAKKTMKGPRERIDKDIDPPGRRGREGSNPR